jgi:2-polyprenyl-3-methyl-5-hydroxy-6-metoxy-1,4-benzoquinol methylase
MDSKLREADEISDQHVVANDSNRPTGYLLPDYWIVPLCDNTGLWRLDHEAYVERVCEIVKSSGAETVLEAGCGDGWNCHKLAERGLDVVGCDWSQNGIDHAKRLVPNARFHCGDLTDPEFERTFSRLFDAVFLIEVIEHIPPDECAATLANVVRFLRPGGTFVLTTPSTNQPNDNPQHYRHFDETTIRSVLSTVQGLEVVAVEGYGDAVFGRTHCQIMRLFDNRFYRVKPLKRWLDGLYRRRHARRTSLQRCRGLIVTGVKCTAVS